MLKYFFYFDGIILVNNNNEFALFECLFQSLSVWPVLSVAVFAAGVFYLYSLILRHLAKTTVRNKVVLITDSLSTLGNGAAFSEQLDHSCHAVP